MKHGNANFWTKSISITEIWNDRPFGKCHNRSYKNLYLWRILWNSSFSGASMRKLYDLQNSL